MKTLTISKQTLANEAIIYRHNGNFIAACSSNTLGHCAYKLPGDTTLSEADAPLQDIASKIESRIRKQAGCTVIFKTQSI